MAVISIPIISAGIFSLFSIEFDHIETQKLIASWKMETKVNVTSGFA